MCTLSKVGTVYKFQRANSRQLARKFTQSISKEKAETAHVTVLDKCNAAAKVTWTAHAIPGVEPIFFSVMSIVYTA